MNLFQVLVLVLLSRALAKDRKLASGCERNESGYTDVRFGPLSVPKFNERHLTRASSTVTINGETRDIGFKNILKTGDVVGSAVAGMLLDIDGDPIYQLVKNNTAKGASSHLSVMADFVSITTGKDGKKYLMSHWEDSPGQMYASEIEISSDCEIVVTSLIPVNFSAWGGLSYPCAGSVSPWGTHLGSEEHDPDARIIKDFWDDPSSDYVLHARYFKKYPGDYFVDYNDFLSVYNPYNYGFVTEVHVDVDGVPQATKWLTLGRLSVEHALIMPDNKTVYVTDDTDFCAFVAFVMEEPGDLSSGTLYTIKLIQNEAWSPFFDVEWIPLASATQAELLDLKDAITFDDIFLYHEYNGTCPEGFKAVSRYAIKENFTECLQLQPGMERAAAFFETRRYSGYVGGTIELSGLESVTYDEKRNKLYVAISYQEFGMSEGITSGETDDIIVSLDYCGCVYQSDYIESEGWLQLTTFSPLICGFEPYWPNADNYCDVNNIAGPDNIYYMGNGAGPDILLISEDGDGRSNDYLWAFDLTMSELTRIMTTPYGSEVTGSYVFDDVDECTFLISVTQHPYVEGHEEELNEQCSTGTKAAIGYIGPIPAFRGV